MATGGRLLAYPMPQQDPSDTAVYCVGRPRLGPRSAAGRHSRADGTDVARYHDEYSRPLARQPLAADAAWFWRLLTHVRIMLDALHNAQVAPPRIARVGDTISGTAGRRSALRCPSGVRALPVYRSPRGAGRPAYRRPWGVVRPAHRRSRCWCLYCCSRRAGFGAAGGCYRRHHAAGTTAVAWGRSEKAGILTRSAASVGPPAVISCTCGAPRRLLPPWRAWWRRWNPRSAACCCTLATLGRSGGGWVGGAGGGRWAAQAQTSSAVRRRRGRRRRRHRPPFIPRAQSAVDAAVAVVYRRYAHGHQLLLVVVGLGG